MQIEQPLCHASDTRRRAVPGVSLRRRVPGPDADVAPATTFESFRVFDLLLDSTERERRTLAQRRMYRTIAPWTAENPLMFHKVNSDAKSIRDASNKRTKSVLK